MFVQNVFDPPRAANIVGDKLVDAKEPWHCEQASERPECEPNRDPFMSVVRSKLEDGFEVASGSTDMAVTTDRAA